MAVAGWRDGAETTTRGTTTSATRNGSWGRQERGRPASARASIGSSAGSGCLSPAARESRESGRWSCASRRSRGSACAPASCRAGPRRDRRGRLRSFARSPPPRPDPGLVRAPQHPRGARPCRRRGRGRRRGDGRGGLRERRPGRVRGGAGPSNRRARGGPRRATEGRRRRRGTALRAAGRSRCRPRRPRRTGRGRARRAGVIPGDGPGRPEKAKGAGEREAETSAPAGAESAGPEAAFLRDISARTFRRCPIPPSPHPARAPRSS